MRRARAKVESGEWHVAVQVQLLRNVTNPCPGSPLDRAFEWDRADERPEEHRLACAVWSDNRQRRSTTDVERQVRQDASFAEANGEVIDLDDAVRTLHPDEALLAPKPTFDNRYSLRPLGGRDRGDAPERPAVADPRTTGERVRT
jgi:hypothetical protein